MLIQSGIKKFNEYNLFGHTAAQGVHMESTKNKKLMRGSTFIAGGVCAVLAIDTRSWRIPTK